MSTHPNQPFSTSRAYLIGVANYRHALWRLETPLRDAEALAALLRERQGFEVELLADPTAAQMRDFFEKIKRDNTAEDARVLIYYAGHGVQRDSATGLKGYFLPADAQPGVDDSMVPMEALSEILRGLPARHLLLVLDCCFAGAFRMLGKRSIGFDGPGAPLRRQHYDIFCSFPSRLVLTSTSHRQKAFDRFEDGDTNSPFNRFLVKAIGGEADYTRDRLVTASELKTYLSESVSQLTEYAGNLQSVGLDGLEGDGEGEFLFFLDGFNAAQLPEQAYLNPYKGLQSYEPRDAALFFGRHKATQSLVDKVFGHRFVIVAGASGTGKSSLVKAGLLPRLAGRHAVIVRPGKHPLAALPPASDWDILVIDQWEEVITQAADEQEVEQFYTRVRELLDAGKHVIGTVRSDFEAQTRHDTLEPYWTEGRFVVPPFTSEEYHDVIVQPAKRVACLFEDRDLVTAIEQEVAQQPGPLPLLSFMLSELFERAKKETTRYRTIRRSHYEAVGGVSGALRNKADEVFQNLPDEAHRDTMRRLTLRMVALSAGEMAGRRVLLEELDFHDDTEDRRVQTVVQNLDDAKLIRRDADDAGRRYIEPAHDALVRAWRRLWDWVKELGEENLLLHAKIMGAVGDYRSKQADRAFLWTADPRLEQARALMQQEPLLLNAAERDFTESSLREKSRRTRRTRMIVAIVGAVILAAAILAWIQRNVARQNLDNFVKADAERIEQEKQKERGNFDKYVRDGDTFATSGDYDLALGKYRKADSILLKFPDDATLHIKAAMLRGKIDSCQIKLNASAR